MPTMTGPHGCTAQSGFVLIMSLVTMLLATLLSAAAMRVAGLQSQMSAGDQHSRLALEAADLAVRHGESTLRTPFFDRLRLPGCYLGSCDATAAGSEPEGIVILSAGGLSDGDTSPDAFMKSNTWSRPAVRLFKASSDAPVGQLVFEYLPQQFSTPDLNPDSAARGHGTAVYRVTGRSTGPNNRSPVVTQSLYEKRY